MDIDNESGAVGLQEDCDDTDVDEDGTYSCNGCGLMISGAAGSTWYRCTACIDTDLCQNCFMKGIHPHHKRHISKFVCPSESEMEMAYCDACGYVFTTDESYNRNCFVCNMCEDYCICASCKGRLMHLNHFKYLKQVKSKKYLEAIT